MKTWILDNWLSILNSLVLLMTATLAWLANRQRKKEIRDLRGDRSEDFGRTFLINNVEVSRYGDAYTLGIDMTNNNNSKPLSVNGVVCNFENRSDITAGINRQEQREFHLEGKERGKLEATLSSDDVEGLHNKKFTLTVHDSDENLASVELHLTEGNPCFLHGETKVVMKSRVVAESTPRSSL